MALAKPTISPITPPPNATKVLFLSRPNSNALSSILLAISNVLYSSPSGNTSVSTTMFFASSSSSDDDDDDNNLLYFSRYMGAMLSFVISNTRFPDTCDRSIDEASSSPKPEPMYMG